MLSTILFNRLFQAIIAADQCPKEVKERFKREQESLLSDPKFSVLLNPGPSPIGFK